MNNVHILCSQCITDVIGDSPKAPPGGSTSKSRGGKLGANARCSGDSNTPFSVSMRHAFVPFKGKVFVIYYRKFKTYFSFTLTSILFFSNGRF